MTNTIITYFVAINVASLVVSILDKGFAVHQKPRVPEKLLLALSLSGGAVGAKVAQIVSGHKTLKLDFCVSLNLIAFLQFGAAVAVWSEMVREDAFSMRDALAAMLEKEEAADVALVSEEREMPRRFGPGS